MSTVPTQDSKCSFAPTASSGIKHAQTLMHFNENIFKRNVLTDVECVVDGQVFRAHRAVLICFSPYLKRKLVSVDGKPISTQVKIPRIGPREFELLLRYMYTGAFNVGCHNFYEVYKAASILEMQNTKQECLQMLDSVDEIRSYFYVFVMSKKMDITHNWTRALRLITHRFEEAAFTPEFMDLEVHHVLEILSAENIGARSEVIVLLAALNWLNKDYPIRRIHAVRVMECVRFSTMSAEEVVACYHPPFLTSVMQIPEITLQLFRATCYITAKSLGQEAWFKLYASPKRNLAFENLPMLLWNTKPSSPKNSLLLFNSHSNTNLLLKMVSSQERMRHSECKGNAQPSGLKGRIKV
ncbi:kelch repeat and BTB domain-containing protein 12-like [Uloborus diversus]|uniref:kelch repeat and BTB domain-containing protein 12-like n=1 Tax=Uloborus diversus TaxID=327109 RepID=UPI002409A11B|nr:kelch repeat and BTB domain-containing protein 12-like [Uloborus diversus]